MLKVNDKHFPAVPCTTSCVSIVIAVYSAYTTVSLEIYFRRGVCCYRVDRMLRSVRANNGIESVNNAVKKAISHASRFSLSILIYYVKH